MRKAEALKRIRAARDAVQAEITGNAGHGRVASGLSSEGYAGGYRDALFEVEALLTHGSLSDSRGYWRRRP